MARESLRLRRADGLGTTRPVAGAGEFAGGLRSDFTLFADDPSVDLADKTISIQDVDHTTVRVSYDPDAIPDNIDYGAPLESQLIRSTAGFPATNLDGILIAAYLTGEASLNGGIASVLDSGLVGGRWYYYSLFARYLHLGETYWIKVGEASWLNPTNYGYQEKLWQGLPPYYRSMDSSDDGQLGLMRKLTNVLGYELDVHRTWAETLGDLWDFTKLSAKLLPEAGAALGMTQIAPNGDKRTRNLAGNMAALRKRKGTIPGIEGYISAMSGFRTRAYVGPNLMLLPQHSTFEHAFAAQNGSADPKTFGHPGWSTRNPASGPDRGQLSRVVSVTNDADGPPNGTPYMQITNNTGSAGTVQTFYGDYSYGTATMIPVVGGHSYKFGASLRASVSSVIRCRLQWFNSAGTLLGTPTHDFPAVGTTWFRMNTVAFVAPASAAFVRIDLQVPGNIANAGWIAVWHPIWVDLAWRPVGNPLSAAPLSSNLSTDLGTYLHEDYWESPRSLWINVYPQRTNFALNSNFKLNNLPVGAWTTAEAPTYDLMAQGYSSYDDIVDGAPADGEVSYDDLAASINPLSGAVNPAYEIGYSPDYGRMFLQVSSAPFAATVASDWFPVNDIGMSAAVNSWSGANGTKLTMRIEWYTDDTTASKITNPDGSSAGAVAGPFTLTSYASRYELNNAIPPEGAVYGRLLLTTQNTIAHTTNFTWALIEDAPFAGQYFNGDDTDGDYGDFFYAAGGGYDGAPGYSPSVYYMMFKQMMGGVNGADLISRALAEQLPVGTQYKIVSAANGLYVP